MDGRVHRHDKRATAGLFSFTHYTSNKLTPVLAQVIKLKPERCFRRGCNVRQPSVGQTADHKRRAPLAGSVCGGHLALGMRKPMPRSTREQNRMLHVLTK